MNPTEILQALGGCMHEFTLSYGLFASLFVAGLIGGFTHCILMCGPFVVSQSKNLSKIRDNLLIPYHLGRITTYAVLAVLLSSLLNLAFLFMPIRELIIAPILMLAGLIFFVTAFPTLLRVFPWAAKIGLGIPYRWIEAAFSKLSHTQSRFGQYLVGVLLGFMPCGMIVSALMAAATASTPLYAGLAMVVFGVGTMPALFSVSMGGRALHFKYPDLMHRLSRGAMVWSGLWLFAIAGYLLV